MKINVNNPIDEIIIVNFVLLNKRSLKAGFEIFLFIIADEFPPSMNTSIREKNAIGIAIAP